MKHKYNITKFFSNIAVKNLPGLDYRNKWVEKYTAHQNIPPNISLRHAKAFPQSLHALFFSPIAEVLPKGRRPC
jgi:hypothetical protein